MVARLTSAILYIGHVTVPKGVLPYSAKFYQVLVTGQVKTVEIGRYIRCHLIRIFYARYRKSLLARLLLAPW
jgi:hypothetical protein